MASNGCMTPSWPTSSSITRISRALIRSLTRMRSLCRKLRSAIRPPQALRYSRPGSGPQALAFPVRPGSGPEFTTHPAPHGAKAPGDGLSSIARGRTHAARGKSLAWHKASAGHHVNKRAESNEDTNEIGGDRGTGLRRQILGKKAVGDARSNQKEKPFPRKNPEDNTNRDQNNPLPFTHPPPRL